MTPYQYRKLKNRIFPALRTWHNIKNVMLDLLKVIGVFVGFVLFPCVVYTILNFLM